MNSVNILESKDKFKIGDWFYLGRYAYPIKLTSQEVINIKLGIRVKAKDWNENIYVMRKIIEIKFKQLYYNESQTIISK